jgi:hypothetical protein
LPLLWYYFILIPQGYLPAATQLVNSNQEMEFTNAIQILSLGILGAAGTALFLDFLKAKRQLEKAIFAWKAETKEALQ